MEPAIRGRARIGGRGRQGLGVRVQGALARLDRGAPGCSNLIGALLGAANREELVGHGVAVIVGTRDAKLRPAVARGWGPALSEDGATVIVSVEALLAP